ncbi:MAG TPA: hypothetical protein VHG91_11765 [Longimicrobium sp.]|nr:hypothetical protein [Longimicrobium sp.]
MAPPQPSQRVRFVDHRGARILMIDLSELHETGDILREIDTVRALVSAEPPDSVRTLSYVKGARYSPPVMDALKELTAHNKPYVKAAAVVGMERLHRVLFRAVLLFSRRNMEVFTTLDQARDWLASQP